MLGEGTNTPEVSVQAVQETSVVSMQEDDRNLNQETDVEPDVVSIIGHGDENSTIIINSAVVTGKNSIITPDEWLQPNRSVNLTPSRSRSLSSLHPGASSTTSRSSSCSSPVAEATALPELSKSATVAMLTFQRNRRKGSGRKRKKRRDRRRK